MERNRDKTTDKRIDEMTDPVEAGRFTPDSGTAGGDVNDSSQDRDIGRPIPADKGVAKRDRHPLDTDES
jgi:hypothetical protein